jgi:hypothetical protein
MNTDNLQISPILFDSLHNNPLDFNPKSGLNFIPTIEQKLSDILAYDKAVQHILELGIEEHSGDWDPFYTIKTKTKEYDTGSGASQIISHTKYHITFLNYDEDGNETELEISIKNIISITLQR